MRHAALFFLILMAATVAPAVAGEFEDYCANGLANYKVLFATDCSVNWTDGTTGKTYCFSSERSKREFLQDVETNRTKASENLVELQSD